MGRRRGRGGAARAAALRGASYGPWIPACGRPRRREGGRGAGATRRRGGARARAGAGGRAARRAAHGDGGRGSAPGRRAG